MLCIYNHTYTYTVHIFKIYLNRSHVFITMNNGFINNNMDVNVDLEHRGKGTKNIFYLEHVSVFIFAQSRFIHIL